MKKNCLMIFILFLLFSCDNDKIKPGVSENNIAEQKNSFQNIVTVEEKQISNIYEAVGTIRPLTESVIEAQISSQVLKVNIVPGDAVKKGDVLITLDARRLNTLHQQSIEGVKVAKNILKQTYNSIDEAKANLDQAKATYNRTEKLFKADIIPSQKLEIDKALFLQAKARLEKTRKSEQSSKASIRQAQEMVKEAKIAFEYSNITAPSSGVVTKRMVDPGDLAVPGKPLLVIQTSGALRLEANVRESCMGKILQGNEYEVKITNIDKSVLSVIEEIVPYADPATRTFMVKAAIPKTFGVYPGMFGRLLIPLEKESTLLIPQKAVIRVGQLELVNVKNNNSWQRVYIKTGRVFDKNIEVLSGLSSSETIGW